MLGISLNVVFIAVIQHLGTSPRPGFVFLGLGGNMLALGSNPLSMRQAA